MSFVADLSERYFAGRLSPEVLALLAPIDGERAEVQNFVERMGRQFHRTGIRAEDVAESFALIVGTFLPKILPGAWGGAVPPVTQHGRHRKIDEYLARNPWRALSPGDALLDLGCGFPPLTTIETAERFPEVRVVGTDPSFGRYLVRKANGDYAVFDRNGDLLYFQPAITEIARWESLYHDPAATRRHFSELRDALRPLLPPETDGTASVTRDGVELVREPVKAFERPNARFEKFGFGAAGLRDFAVARCFNVLYYFDNAFRREALDWLAGVLIEGGICVSGGNWSNSRSARYTVHRVEHGALVAREFAFSIENLRPLELVTVFTLHDRDHDLTLLSSALAVLRGDEQFRRDVDRRIDEVQAEIGFCARKPNGYLGGIQPGADPALLGTATQSIGLALEREGYPERAAGLLESRGFRAWVNCVGHVAFDPISAPA